MLNDCVLMMMCIIKVLLPLMCRPTNTYSVHNVEDQNDGFTQYATYAHDESLRNDRKQLYI
jgi:hypothetical protein